MKFLRALLAVSLLASTTGCPITEPNTPASKLEDTWRSVPPITLFYQTDFCNDVRQNVSTAKWDVTWKVSAQEGYSNVLDIEMNFTRSASTPLAASCGGDSGWVPVVSPTFLEAVLNNGEIVTSANSSDIHVFGTYSGNTMTMTWVHYECIIYCTGEVSSENTFILTRQ